MVCVGSPLEIPEEKSCLVLIGLIAVHISLSQVDLSLCIVGLHMQRACLVIADKSLDRRLVLEYGLYD